MTERVTEVGAGGQTLTLHGVVDRDEALLRFREHYERQADKARRALDALDAGEETVWTQLGVWAGRERREVPR